MGFIEDTNMPDNGFAHLAIAFYCSFLVAEPIQAYLIQRLPTAKVLSVNGAFQASFRVFLQSRKTNAAIVVICWGIVLTMNCICHDFASVMALRVLLGIFESATAPRSVQNGISTQHELT